MPGLRLRFSRHKWELDKTLPSCKQHWLSQNDQNAPRVARGIFVILGGTWRERRGDLKLSHVLVLGSCQILPCTWAGRIPEMLGSSKTNWSGEAFWSAPFLQLVRPCRRRLGLARSSTFESGGNLVNGIADVAVDCSYAWEVELRWRHGTSQHLHANGEEAATGRLICLTWAAAFAIAWTCASCCGRRVRSWEDGKAKRQERDVRRVLAAHCHLDSIHIHGSKHHEASTIRVGAALLQ